jgi:hypothetical protein
LGVSAHKRPGGAVCDRLADVDTLSVIPACENRIRKLKKQKLVLAE